MSSINKAWLTRMVSYNSRGSFEQIERAQQERERQRMLLVAAAVLAAFWLASLAAELLEP